MFKIVNDIAPNYLKNLIPQRNLNFNYNLRERNNNKLINLVGRTELFNKLFIPFTIRAWNNIDIQIRLVANLSQFKSQLCRANAVPKPCSCIHRYKCK